MAKIIKVNHIGIVVPEIESALGFWRDGLGLTLDHVEDVPGQKAKVAFFPLGESEVELVQPTTSDSGIVKFLADRGPGMHHLCFEVDDIEGMIVKLKANGARMINEVPQELEGRLVAFVHPKSANGVLIELYQSIQ
ncbi:MAG: methylmalonyl-CoA epimerase [Anaerolineaceae bacterium]|nr:methylmalonyl-CoA epimerase [Anaerolineaceae bacterium]